MIADYFRKLNCVLNFSDMYRFWSAAVLVLFWGQAHAGHILKIHGNGFSFLITEPDGWVIDVESAAQIANFVMHEQGTTWRQATVMVFGRLMEKEKNENLQSFMKLDVDQFEENCPGFEVKDVPLNIPSEPKFLAKAYNCPGARREVTAFAEVDNLFAVFILTAKKKELIDKSLPAFSQMLSSFRWLGRTSWRTPRPR